MSDSERWARTDEQVARFQEAKTYGRTCAVCGRALDDGEPVFLDSLAVGARRSWPTAPVTPRSHTLAPVGRECARGALLRHAEDHAAEPCASCGRGVVAHDQAGTQRPSRTHP